MKKLRQIHLYLGVLFAPSILFFAFTGAYQTFRWNETGALGALTPIASQMASIHKNAALERKREAESPGEAEPNREASQAAPLRRKEPKGGNTEESQSARRTPSPLPLKIYIFLMSLGLITSTATGVLLAFKYNHSRRLIWGLLIAGTVLPLVLMFI